MDHMYSSAEFEAKFTYEGCDLGANWSKQKTLFRVWAPTASRLFVNLYRTGNPKATNLICRLEMTPDANGTWVAQADGDLNGVYYTYCAEIGGRFREACDPYARTTGLNGHRAMVLDLASTDPAGWEEDTPPQAGKAITDAVIYELHLRDLSMDKSSGIRHKGKFLGLAQAGTATKKGTPTGLDHIQSLGVTHVHLLPVYDYGSVDESRNDQFNWGYDPVNYNVPEGAYATNPKKGQVRVKEMKQMVKALHDHGLGVIMDVVYNHVYDAGNFCFNKLVPGYFSRMDGRGGYSNGSGCGNDTASERSMVRKYIVDSVLYWAEEYHIDGFRFDLVGLLDAETVNAIVSAVHEKHPHVLFYGEGWSMATAVTKPNTPMATQANAGLTPKFAYFSDTMRDALRGHVFTDTAKGYVSGQPGLAGNMMGCMRGTLPWTNQPKQIINYASCHDNMTLFDRLALCDPGAPLAMRVRQNNLAAAICMTAQGVPFFQAGEEMLRSKPLVNGGFADNSYNLPDQINSLKWKNLDDPLYRKVLDYYKGLIAFRRAHPALRMTDPQEIDAHFVPVYTDVADVVAFTITPGANGDKSAIFVALNPRKEGVQISLPQGNWEIFVAGSQAGMTALGTARERVTVEPVSALVMVQCGE